jgi:hypothetical protein
MEKGTSIGAHDSLLSGLLQAERILQQNTKMNHITLYCSRLRTEY